MTDAYIDANVLLRFFTKDPPEMAEQARQTLAAAAEGEFRLILTPVVLAEIVWTLSSFYGFERKDIADRLISLLTVKGMDVRDRDVLAIALSLYGERNLDFADALLSAYALVEGPRQVCTFDRDFQRVPGLIILEPGSTVAGQQPDPFPENEDTRM